MDIPRYSGENLGSLIKIECIPAHLLDNFNSAGNGLIHIGDITLLPGASWQQVYCGVDTMGHSQVLTADNNGKFWAQSVVGIIPGDEAAIESAILSFTDQRYVVRVTRPDGVIRIAGTKSQPLDFTLNSNTQTTVPGTSGTAINFSGKTINRALIQIP